MAFYDVNIIGSRAQVESLKVQEDVTWHQRV
jgi:hypothetical protein